MLSEPNRRTVVLLLLFPAILLITSGCRSQQKADSPPKPVGMEQLTYCTSNPATALLTLATSKELFAQQGLTVTFKLYPLGVDAQRELLAGNCDVANTAETPLVIESFKHSDLKVLAALRSTDNLPQLVVRQDKGINDFKDLKGRRIGIPKGTVPNYFLDLELAGLGWSQKDITPVFMPSDKLTASLSDGSVDAIATISNMAFRARQKMGDKVIVLQNPGLCRNYSLLITMQGFADKHPERIQRLLKALYAAEQFKNESPKESRALLISSLKLTDAEYDAIWSNYDDRLSLNSALLMTLEEHARWVISKGLVNATSIPNYLTTIDATHLQKAAPAAVTLRR